MVLYLVYSEELDLTNMALPDSHWLYLTQRLYLTLSLEISESIFFKWQIVAIIFGKIRVLVDFTEVKLLTMLQKGSGTLSITKCLWEKSHSKHVE